MEAIIMYCRNKKGGSNPLFLANLIIKIILINVAWATEKEFDNTCSACDVPMKILLMSLGVGGLITSVLSLCASLKGKKLESSALMYPFVTVMATELFFVSTTNFYILFQPSPSFVLRAFLTYFVESYVLITLWCIYAVIRERERGIRPESTVQIAFNVYQQLI